MTDWTPDIVCARIDALGPWFLNMRLKYCPVAHNSLGDGRNVKCQYYVHISPDLRGQIVLDIGCNAGFFATEMKRRGAGRVPAIDCVAAHLNQAGFAAEVENLHIELRQSSLHDVGAI